ncbi:MULTISPECIES: AMIN-like domain-containing (lipo)protein [unclassified Modestobacter]|uniref:AMIN-like domain-containing (lipo)protein n=1 Tax=unclassified Modestobacter TaxID=2643866 RepID=UPI0022AA0FFF|nr:MULTISPECIES: hypothetical protein [unclassified Modestobacter]MCZ2823453.1 hypothetical protein [Modestobacter sp. VKM Ac-2981]MCZ2851698.1 hypothetical protein [Modestobacter sp. VKM Ac-2982]
MLIRRPARVTRSAGLAVALLLVAGCAAQPDTDSAGSTGEASSSSAAPEATTETTAETTAAASESPAAEFPADTSADTADPVDPEGLTVTAVRAAEHEGYDRVVFELAGSGTPGWRVEYVDAPSSQGSGSPVDVPGTAFLQVTLQGTSYPYETGAEEVARGPVSVSGTGTVQGVVYDATFEGTSVAWIGTSAEVPFRVSALSDPTRLVVEVADAG